MTPTIAPRETNLAAIVTSLSAMIESISGCFAGKTEKTWKETLKEFRDSKEYQDSVGIHSLPDCQVPNLSQSSLATPPRYCNSCGQQLVRRLSEFNFVDKFDRLTGQPIHRYDEVCTNPACHEGCARTGGHYFPFLGKVCRQCGLVGRDPGGG